MFFSSYQKKDQARCPTEENPHDTEEGGLLLNAASSKGVNILSSAGPGFKSDYNSIECTTRAAEDFGAETADDPRVTNEEDCIKADGNDDNSSLFRGTKKNGALFLVSSILFTAATVAAVGGLWSPFGGESLSGQMSMVAAPPQMKASIVMPTDVTLTCPEDIDTSAPEFNAIANTVASFLDPTGIVWDLAMSLGEMTEDSSELYSCNSNTKLLSQMDRILTRAKLHVDQVQFHNAYSFAETFFNKMSTFKGNSALQYQKYTILADLENSASAAISAAKGAKIIGAELLGKVAIFRSSIIMLQLGKVEDIPSCNPTVRAFMNNINNAISHLKLSNKTNFESGQNYNGRWSSPYALIPNTNRCRGDYTVQPNTDNAVGSVLNVYVEDTTGAVSRLCTKPYQCCHDDCRDPRRRLDTSASCFYCETCCWQWECDARPVPETETRATQRYEKLFTEEYNTWFYGSQGDDADEEGVQYYLEQLEHIQGKMNEQKLRNMCGKTVGLRPPTTTTAPTPVPPPPVPAPPGGGYCAGCNSNTPCRSGLVCFYNACVTPGETYYDYPPC